LASASNVSKKLRQFRMTAPEDQVAEEEEEYSLIFPSLLIEKLK
jgi:hypothetical protein